MILAREVAIDVDEELSASLPDNVRLLNAEPDAVPWFDIDGRLIVSFQVEVESL